LASIVTDGRAREVASLKAFENLLRLFPEFDSQTVMQSELTVFADRCVHRQLGIGRPAMDQRASRVVTYSAEH
jgi:hypothetical protein